MIGEKPPQEDRFAEIDGHDQPTEPMARIVLAPLSPTFGAPATVPWQNHGHSSVPSPAQKPPRPSVFPGLVGVFFVAVQLLLLLRFVLQLFVQPGSRLTLWEGIFYSVSSVFLLPFRLLLQNIPLPAVIGSQLSGSLTILVAILMYGLLSRILVRFLKALWNTR